MECEDRELENQLSRLSPSQPSRELRQRIANSLESSSSLRKEIFLHRHWAISLGFGAAAILALCWSLWSALGNRINEESFIEPSEIRMEVASPLLGDSIKGYRKVEGYRSILAADQGPVYPIEEDQLVRNIYIKYVDTEILENDNGTARFTVSSPREEILVVPASSY